MGDALRLGPGHLESFVTRRLVFDLGGPCIELNLNRSTLLDGCGPGIPHSDAFGAIRLERHELRATLQSPDSVCFGGLFECKRNDQPEDTQEHCSFS